MGPPPEVTSGTFVYLAITLAIIGFTWISSSIGKISKDSAQILTVVTATGGVCMWLLWLCAWMHQWHPLITPTWKNE